jgi:hypothetical protein
MDRRACLGKGKIAATASARAAKAMPKPHLAANPPSAPPRWLSVAGAVLFCHGRIAKPLAPATAMQRRAGA